MTIGAFNHIQMAAEEAYFMTDTETLPLTNALKYGDRALIEQNLEANTLEKRDLGQSIVEAAKYFDTSDLQLLLNCSKVAEVDSEYISQGIWFADNQTALDLLLGLPQAQLLPVRSLEMAFTRSCALGYTKPFKKMMQMPVIRNAQAKELYLLTNMLALVESNAIEELNLLLNSPLAIQLSSEEFSELYLTALEKGHGKIADAIQKHTTKLTHPEFALLFAAKHNHIKAVEHLITTYVIHSDYLIGAIRLAERYGYHQIIEELFPLLNLDQLTEIGKAILTYTLWANCCRNPNKLLRILPKLMNTDISKFCKNAFEKQKLAAGIDLFKLVGKELNSGGKFASLKYQYMELIENKLDKTDFSQSNRSTII